MMKKKLTLFLMLFFCCATWTFAQEPEDEVVEEPEVPELPMMARNSIVTKDLIKNKKPVPYAHVRQEDVLWSEVVWRTIDCRDRMNYPLYFPTISLSHRQSLVQVLVEGIQNKKVQAYDTDGDEFQTKLTPAEVLARFDAGDRVFTVPKLDGTGDTTIIQKNAINWSEVREFQVKEEWFFDRHRSILDVRIIGICPIRVWNKVLSTGGEEDVVGQEVRKQLFWVYFPEARRVLANTICYAGNNELANISFDDLFHKRRFSSYIIRQSNPLNDRRIGDYARNGVEAIMESNRMKDEVIKFENDFWEY